MTKLLLLHSDVLHVFSNFIDQQNIVGIMNKYANQDHASKR